MQEGFNQGFSSKRPEGSSGASYPSHQGSGGNNGFSGDVDLKKINSICCCFNLRKVTRAVTQFFDRQLERIGVRSTQFTLLIGLASVSAKTLTEIAQSLVMDRTTLTRNLKPLEKMGYIATLPAADRRAKVYELTESGRAIVAKALPIWTQAQKQIVQAIGADRYQLLLGEINYVLSAVPEISQKP